MAVEQNRDHVMPRHVDVFEWIERCARDSKCSVWGCGLPSSVSTHEPVPGAAFAFEVPFCSEHAADFKSVAADALKGELPDDG